MLLSLRNLVIGIQSLAFCFYVICLTAKILTGIYMNTRVDLLPSYWIFVWFILYIYKVVPYSPKLSFVLALLFEFVIAVAMFFNSVSKYYIGTFVFIQIIMKVIPLYILRNETIDFLPQLFYTGILLSIFYVWLSLNTQDGITHFAKQMKGLSEGKIATPGVSIIYPQLMKIVGDK